MKKITAFLAFLLLSLCQINAQVLNDAANWPNTNWTVGGTYNPLGLVNNPTIDVSFTFDDDAAGNGSADIIYAESPVINLTAAKTAGEIWITISGDFVYRPLGGDVLKIDYWNADASNWVPLHTFLGNTTTTADYQGCLNMVTYTTSVLNINGFSATQLAGFKYRIHYNDAAGWQWGWCVGSPTIVSSLPPSCPNPSILAATNITSNSASLGWTENGSATTWNVEWGATGFTQGTGTMVTGTTNNPEPITGLAPETSYDFYVQADCGGSGTSAWVGPFSFTTDVVPGTCGIYSIDLVDTWGDGWNGGFLDVYINGSLYADSLSLINGNGPVTFQIPVNIGDIVSIDYTAGDFSTENEYYIYDQNSNLIVSEGLGSTTPNDVGNYTLPSGLTACPACPDPSTLTATSITSSSANLGWTENGSANTWNVEWGATGFTQGTGTMVTGTTNNPEPITGLATSTTYDFYVQADCGGSGTSAWVGPFSFTTLCVAPVISSFPWTENFDGVTTPAMPCGWMVDNVNADTYTWLTGTTASSSPNSMQIRWNTTQAANDWSFTPELVLVGGTTYELSFAFAVAGATFPEKLKVMYGSAQNVAGMANLLFDSTLTNTVFDTAFATFTPATSGSYYIGFHNYSDADMFRVYVDDVTLKEAVADTCSIPSNLTANNITTTSAMLDWTENGNATEWDIEWGLQGFTLGTGTPEHVTAKPYLLDGLSPSTAYEYYVRADCGSGDTSLWVGPFMFVTDPCPFVIIDLGNDTTLCSDQSITLNAPFNPNWGYGWSPVGSGGPSNTLDTAVLGGNGTYNVMLNVIDFTNGCMYFDAINVTFSVCTGLEETSAIDFSIYPNPNNGVFTVRTKENGTVEVTNLQGKVVYKNTLNSTSQVIDLSANAKGIYFVTVTTTNGVEVQKMVIQ